jgi:hypothetical protein
LKPVLQQIVAGISESEGETWHPYAIPVTLLSLSELKDLFNGRNVVMYFDQGRVLNKPHYKNPETRDRVSPASSPAQQSQVSVDKSEPGVRDWEAANMLDSANNKLQELMQILYLLSRDPAVPNDARYHVTVAQSEIALLAHVMRNTADGGQSDGLSQPESLDRPSARP